MLTGLTHPFSLEGKRILVTGASSGIGRSCAIELSKLGAQIILVARSQTRLEECLGCLSGVGHIIEVFDLDCGEKIVEWLKSLSQRTGAIDGLIHAAGMTKTMPIRAMNQASYDQILKINLESSYFLAKAFRQKGVYAKSSSLLFIGSVMSVVGQAGLSAYCASKGALVTLAKSLAIEFSNEGIRVNVIAPGLVKTPLVDAELNALPSTALDALNARHPLGIGKPEDVAYASAFLVSDASRWITGTTLVVDGGYTAA